MKAMVKGKIRLGKIRLGKRRRCVVCGCHEYHACVIGGLPCWWIGPSLCAACGGQGSKRP